MLKKAVQQGRRAFGARSVHGVREQAKNPRTQLAAFFNFLREGSEKLAKPSAIAVDPLLWDRLLNAQRVLWQTFQSYAEARFELSVALTELERVVGKEL